MTWDIQGKRVLITGGNCGIGRATAEELCRRGARVVLTARDAAKGAAAVASIEAAVPAADVAWRELDLANRESIEGFAAGVIDDFDRLDVLIHNAGVILSERREAEAGVEMTFMVNHLGPFLLQRRLEPLLRASAPARVILVASDAHRMARKGLDFDDLQFTRDYSGVAVYGASKLANVLCTRELARRLEGSGVSANCLHPGVVATEFTRDGDAGGLWGFIFQYLRFLLLTPEKGARTSVFLASDPALGGRSGGYFSKCRRREPSAVAQDDDAARRLWEESERLLGLTPA